MGPIRSFFFVRLFFCLLLVVMLAMGILAKRGWIDWRRVTEQNQEIQGKLAEAILKRDRLESQITALQTHPEQQEILVRQTLGYVNPSEIIVEFP